MSPAQIAFIENLIRRTAQAAIGPSALRKQGAAGVVSAAREAVAKIDLTNVAALTSDSFSSFLDNATDSLLAAFPPEARNWGAARKAINLFLRDATYNIDLNSRFRLESVRPLLEVPLDRDAATGLREQPEGQVLPRWNTIKRLRPTESYRYQMVASTIALRHQVHRVDLDVFFWRARS